MQWGAYEWHWVDDTHTSIIWTIKSNQMFGVDNFYDLCNWDGALARYKDKYRWVFSIEEVGANGVKTQAYNGFIDNMYNKDNKYNILANYTYYTVDGIITDLNIGLLQSDRLELLSVKAIDDQRIQLTFNRDVIVDNDNVSFSIQYLTKKGALESLADGRSATFKGVCEYKSDSQKNVLIWTLKTNRADNIYDIFNYADQFSWNKGARITFVIADNFDATEEDTEVFTGLILGITDTAGVHHLRANHETEESTKILFDIDQNGAGDDNVGDDENNNDNNYDDNYDDDNYYDDDDYYEDDYYDDDYYDDDNYYDDNYDDNYDDGDDDTNTGNNDSNNRPQTIYATNYLPFIIGSAAIAVAGLALALILFFVRKKANK